MNLHVKRFNVRHKGVNYGPNSVIYDVSKDEGEKLIVESNGTIEAMPEREEGSIVDVEKDSDKLDFGGLPTVDPSETVK